MYSMKDGSLQQLMFVDEWISVVRMTLRLSVIIICNFVLKAKLRSGTWSSTTLARKAGLTTATHATLWPSSIWERCSPHTHTHTQHLSQQPPDHRGGLTTANMVFYILFKQNCCFCRLMRRKYLLNLLGFFCGER